MRYDREFDGDSYGKKGQPYSLKRKKVIVKILTPPFNLDHPIYKKKVISFHS